MQIRLLEFGVQAAPPLRDSGNDLVALKGYAVRTIQVKTRTARLDVNGLPDRYHLVAVVRLHVAADPLFRLDQSEIYLIPRAALGNLNVNDEAAMREFLLSQHLVDNLFAEPEHGVHAA